MRKIVKPLWRAWTEFRGRQAIVLLLAMGIVFLGISYAIHQPGVEAFDLRVTKTLQSWQNPLFDAVFVGFTFLGNTLTLIAIALLLSGMLLLKRRRLSAGLTILTLVGLPINMILKDVVERPRPNGTLVDVVLPTIGLSFPSGHAMASTMLYGYLAVLCWMHISERSTRTVAALCFAVTAFMVSLSRVYLGAHWLSDVVGGWTAGLFFLVFVVEAYKHWGKAELQMHAPLRREPTVASYE